MMAGVGGFFGYSSTGIDWEKMMIGKFFGGNVETVFGIVILLIFVSSVISLTSFREIPLPLLEREALLRPLTQAAVKQEVERKKNTVEIVNGVREFSFVFCVDIKIKSYYPTRTRDKFPKYFVQGT